MSQKRKEGLALPFLGKPTEVSVADVVALLEAFGYSESNPRPTSHRVFRKPGCRPLTVPTVKGRYVKRAYILIINRELGLREWYEQQTST